MGVEPLRALALWSQYCRLGPEQGRRNVRELPNVRVCYCHAMLDSLDKLVHAVLGGTALEFFVTE